MAKQAVGNTALGVAIFRVIEQYQPEGCRLFDDPVVKDLVAPYIRLLLSIPWMRNLTILQTERMMKGVYGALMCRTRYIDDGVVACLGQDIRQVVILGAGLDTRAYRLPGMGGVKVFEVDLPGVQEVKKKRLEKHIGRLPEAVTFVPIDFETQTLEEVFARTAFDPFERAVFVWEGVTQYLSEGAVARTLSFVGRSASGSVILFSYVLKNLMQRRDVLPEVDRWLENLERRHTPWVFGLNPEELGSWLEEFHLSLVEDVGRKEYQERYLRSIGRDLAVSEGERVATARVV